jgi:acetoin utilization deacetylase AcuC-like enzyme
MMDNKTGYVYDPIYLRHDTGEHPENAGRLKAIIAMLESTGLADRLTLIKPRPTTLEELSLVHEKAYIARIEEMNMKGGGFIDGETVMSLDTYEAALNAAGGVMAAVDAVMAGTVNSAFALVRPPGHHAAPGRGMGFCIFNNVAIAAAYALKKYSLKRIAIIDFDVHHGNGTQAVFDNEPSVMYISTHQFPHYPGTGNFNETGRGSAAGTKVNIPLPRGCGDTEYLRVFREIIVPVVKRYQPELILVSAGYDPHWSDELAEMQVSISGFARMVSIIKELADEFCGGKLVLALEGGYGLEALAYSVKATFEIMLGVKEPGDPMGPSPHQYTPQIDTLIDAVKKTHGLR